MLLVEKLVFFYLYTWVQMCPKYKMCIGQNRWQPPLQPKPLDRIGSNFSWKPFRRIVSGAPVGWTFGWREMTLYGLVGQSVGRLVFWREVSYLVFKLVGWSVDRLGDQWIYDEGAQMNLVGRKFSWRDSWCLKVSPSAGLLEGSFIMDHQDGWSVGLSFV